MIGFRFTWKIEFHEASQLHQPYLLTSQLFFRCKTKSNKTFSSLINRVVSWCRIRHHFSWDLLFQFIFKRLRFCDEEKLRIFKSGNFFLLFFKNRKWKRMIPSEAIRLVQRCKVSLVLSPPWNLFPLFSRGGVFSESSNISQAHTTRIFLSSFPQTPQESFFTFAGRKKIHSFTHSWYDTHTNQRCGTERNFLHPPFHSLKLRERNFLTLLTDCRLFSVNFLLLIERIGGWVAFENKQRRKMISVKSRNFPIFRLRRYQ